MKKLLFVMNPYAGQKKANRHLVQILEIFNRAGYDVTVYMTAGPGDGEQAVRRLAKDMDVVACCGGDGTLNETIAGIMKAGVDVPIGYIPAGSTNDLANSLGLSTDILRAARDIVEGVAKPLDVGSFGGRYFSYVASFGAFTRASYATPQNVKNALGHMAYILGGIQELSQIRTQRVRFELPDGRIIEDDFLFGAVSNSTSMGGVLNLSKDIVDMADGKFELLLIRAPREFLELTECIIALQKQTYNCSMITFLSTDRVRVSAQPDMDWTLDGEREPGHAHIEVENLHHAVHIIRREV